MKFNKRERMLKILSCTILRALTDGKDLDITENSLFCRGFGVGFLADGFLILLASHVRFLVRKYCDENNIKAPKLRRKILEDCGFIEPDIRTIDRDIEDDGTVYDSEVFAIYPYALVQQSTACGMQK